MKSEILPLILDGYQEAMYLRKIAQGWENEVLTKPEYLFTVKIYESLAIKLNDNSGVNSKYYIKLEEPTHEVSRYCYKPIKFERSENRLSIGARLQKFFTPKRKGNVDIAVYRSPRPQQEQRLVAVIEVKDFNPQGPDIKKDLQRIIDLIENKQDTSDSSFQFGVVTYLVSKNREAVLRKEQNIEKVKRLALSYVPENYRTHSEIECKVLEELLMPEYSPVYEENDIEINSDDYYRYYHVSIIVQNPNPVEE